MTDPIPAAVPVAACVRGLAHRYRGRTALDGIALELPVGAMIGLIGPDGVGKSTLLAILAGVCRIQEGEVIVLEGDMRAARHRAHVCPRIAYMPQGLGQNLYAELSVLENIAFFGRLFDVSRATIAERAAALLAATGLTAFAGRQAGKLSGGMKQKLGLCCALIHEPELLILDEPTTGIDPLSRLQFWDLVGDLRRRDPKLTIIVASSYMTEAEQFDRLLMMDGGRILAEGSPRELKARRGVATLDEAYVALLPPERRRGHVPFHAPPHIAATDEPAVVARGLTRRFGHFTAVDGVEFSIPRGEIFGFVGPNGSGKTTTLKMLAGLLPPSAGEARLFSRPVAAGDGAFRRRIGYMSQSFSLYGELTVRRNLALHAHLFGVPGVEIGPRIGALAARFGLDEVMGQRADDLPLGIRQRLSLAVATIHQPEVLILDEPTSGVDPVARDAFWRLLGELSRQQGVTILVSTHYLAEATRCDRVALMNAGRILVCAAPEELTRRRGAESLEAAFAAHIREDAAAGGEGPAPEHLAPLAPTARVRPRGGVIHAGRLWALAHREMLQVWRDPFRMFSAFLVPLALMLIFGFGLNLDIENLPFAVFDQDRTPESRAYAEPFAASRYFAERPPAHSDAEVERRLGRGEIRLALDIPAGFGRALKGGGRPEVGVWIDGTMPFRAETVRGYTEGVHAAFLRDRAVAAGTAPTPVAAVVVETRFWFNQSLESRYVFVPGLVAFVLMIVPAMLMAVAVVREKELGSITNLYATPLTRLEFIWGKQLPYAAISFVNFLIMAVMVVTVFDVPLGGSALALLLGGFLYVFATTGVGLVISAFTKTQAASVFAATIVTILPSFNYSGLLTPVAGLEGGPYVLGRIFPTSYFLNISVGAYTKDLGLAELLPNHAALIVIFAVLTLLSLAFLRKQRR